MILLNKKFTIKKWIVLLLSLGFLVFFIQYHYWVVTYPFQVEYREGAHFLVSNELSKGNLPFTIQNQPYLSYMYGLLYPLISSIVISIFGSDLIYLRLISGIAIIVLTYYYWYYTNRLGINKLLGLASTIIFYSINLFLCIPSARPDAVGNLFFVLSIFIPYLHQFSKKSLVYSLFYALLAFYTKPYFLVGFLFVTLYMFLFHSMLRGIKYGILYLSILITSLVVVEQLFNFYFLGTLGTQFSESVYDIQHMFSQTNFFFFTLLAFPTSLFLFYLFIKILRKRQLVLSIIDSKKIWLDTFFNYKNIKQGFILSSTPLNFNLFIFMLSFLLLLLKLGGHTGQFGVYYIQFLLFPFLVCINLISINKSPKHIYFIAIIYLLTLVKVFNILPKYPEEKSKTKVFSFFNNLQNHKKILSSPALGSILIKKHTPLYLSGLTEYSQSITGFKNNHGYPKVVAKIKDKLFLKKINSVESLCLKYNQTIENNLKRKYFDYILTDTSRYDNWLINQDQLDANYKKVDSFNLNMFASYTTSLIYVYVPKKK